MPSMQTCLQNRSKSVRETVQIVKNLFRIGFCSHLWLPPLLCKLMKLTKKNPETSYLFRCIFISAYFKYHLAFLFSLNQSLLVQMLTEYICHLPFDFCGREGNTIPSYLLLQICCLTTVLITSLTFYFTVEEVNTYIYIYIYIKNAYRNI